MYSTKNKCCFYDVNLSDYHVHERIDTDEVCFELLNDESEFTNLSLLCEGFHKVSM